MIPDVLHIGPVPTSFGLFLARHFLGAGSAPVASSSARATTRDRVHLSVWRRWGVGGRPLWLVSTLARFVRARRASSSRRWVRLVRRLPAAPSRSRCFRARGFRGSARGPARPRSRSAAIAAGAARCRATATGVGRPTCVGHGLPYAVVGLDKRPDVRVIRPGLRCLAYLAASRSSAPAARAGAGRDALLTYLVLTGSRASGGVRAHQSQVASASPTQLVSRRRWDRDVAW